MIEDSTPELSRQSVIVEDDSGTEQGKKNELAGAPYRGGPASHRWLIYLALIGIAIPFLFPIYWLTTGAFKTPSTIVDVPPAWWPVHWVLTNFRVIFNSGAVDIPRYAWNTLLMCLAWVVAGTAVSALIAYGFARIEFLGRQVLFSTVIIVLILPYWATIAPQYVLFHSLGWLNSLAPVTAPALTGVPFSIFLLREFMRGIPLEVSEAARLDGANEMQIFLFVILPQLTPVLIVTALFQFADTYNSFFLPLVYLTSPANYTLSLGIYQFIQLHGAPDTGAMVAYTLLLSVPLLFVFVVAQKRLTSGVKISGRLG
ncbi:MAG TPA: carbohydrate ABC transporter permease [Acidobacteriaceae bacterium]|nr:carbohydrate ABC transporter permease [Acidobacteriaceae bacterium]